jgi:hypothetical protein
VFPALGGLAGGPGKGRFRPDHPINEKEEKGGVPMAKFHARPSNQYRYEHYDPCLSWHDECDGGSGAAVRTGSGDTPAGIQAFGAAGQKA